MADEPGPHPFDSESLDRLYQSRRPFLIGVRHHSAAMARAIPALLDEADPECLFVELPLEFQPWIEFLGDDQLQAPVALAGVGDQHDDLCFYPFADFSPELAAIRWASRNGVPVQACDLELGLADRGGEDRSAGSRPQGLLRQLLQQTQSRDAALLWERLVETPGMTGSPESIRRAALLFGWALRCDEQRVSSHDLARETRMREIMMPRMETARCAAVVGAFHGAALLAEPMQWTPVKLDASEIRTVKTALIAYGFEQFDERSGYPAGVRDPHWHQSILEANGPEALDSVMVDLAVQICRHLRESGHPANASHAMEVVRFARDLARLRSFPLAGRSELIEAMQSCLTQGELMGMGRAVAKAAETVLVGSRTGTLPGNVPRSGLGPHVERFLSDLQLPGPDEIGANEKRMRLDPLRSRLDRARCVFFRQLNVCGIPYARAVESEEVGARQALTEIWDVSWQHRTAAMLELCSPLGVTLRQVVHGKLVTRDDPDGDDPPQLEQLQLAAECGLTEIVESRLRALMTGFVECASLESLAAALSLMGRIRAGHIPGLAQDDQDEWPGIVMPFSFPADVFEAPLLQAAVDRLDGLAGSDQISDAQALLELVLWFQQQTEDQPSLAEGKLVWSIRRLASDGSPLMQGAAAGGLLLLQVVDSRVQGQTVSGWLDGATDRQSRKTLMLRLRGLLLTALPRLVADLGLLQQLEARIAALDDQQFLQRLPALRGGFDVLSPAVRGRILGDLLDRFPDGMEVARQDGLDDAAAAARRFEADQGGRAAVLLLMPDLIFDDPDLPLPPADNDTISIAPDTNGLALPHRWRLILGAQQDQLPGECWRAAVALDELYGLGHGEGRRPLAERRGAGSGRSFPTVRDWAGELESLFGSDVCEEVIGEAAESGRAAAILALDPEQVKPSIELLQQVLSLHGAMGGDRLELLRRICRRIVDQLSDELANRIRPALTGLATRRPTSRPTRRLNIPRTIRANLQHAYVSESGQTTIVPERMIFDQLARRSMDWHVVFVVDVSGSMEPSVIYSAMVSSILSALPALSVRFLAFSTEVIDLTDHVDDPLSLLLEVQVGGGTHIAKGIRAARAGIRVPNRTLLILVSDFDEGGSLGQLLAEVQSTVSSGTTALGLAALDDRGAPRYNKGVAARVVAAGMPVAALSPLQLARWVGDQIR